MKKAYQGWYKWQSREIETKVENKIEDGGMQSHEGLMHLIRELKLDNQNDQVLNSLIDLSL